MKNDSSTETAHSYVGVDVAKAELQAHLNGAQVTFPNTPTGRKALCQELQAIARAHVIMEATGGYEQPLVAALHHAKILVSVINPAWIRSSAKATGRRAKTDAIDAALLTQYGQRYHPKPTPAATKVQHKLAALTQWLKQLVEAQAVAKAQAEHHIDRYVREQHEALMGHYEAAIKAWNPVGVLRLALLPQTGFQPGDISRSDKKAGRTLRSVRGSVERGFC